MKISENQQLSLCAKNTEKKYLDKTDTNSTTGYAMVALQLHN